MSRGPGRGLDRTDVSLGAPAAAMVLPAPGTEKRHQADLPRENRLHRPRCSDFVAKGHHPASGRRAGGRGGPAQAPRSGSFGAVRTLMIIVTARMANTTPSDTATGIL